MSVELATAWVSIVPSTKGLAGQMRNEVGGPLEDIVAQAGDSGGQRFGANLVSNAVTGLDRMGERIVSTVTTAAKVAATAGAAIIGAGLWGGMQRTLDTEDARKLFGQLGLSVQGTDDLMEDLNETFLTGPFAYPDVYDVSSQLLASGVSMEDLVDSTAAVGNMAAFAGEDLSRVGEITNVIGANGRVMASELNRLGQMGIPIRQILAEALGISGEELSTMVSNGELTSEMFFDLIGSAEQFDGAMEAFGDTTRGAWSIMKAGIAGIGEALLSPWFGEGGTMATFLQSINTMIFDKVQPAMAAFGETVKDRLLPALQSFGDYVTGTIVPALQTGWEWFQRNRETIFRVGEAVGIAVVALGGLATAVHIVRRAIALTPIGLVLALASGLVYAWQNSERFRDIVTETWQTIKSVVAPIIEWFGDRIAWIASLFSGDGEGGAIRDWFEQHVSPVLESLRELFSVVFERVGEVFEWAMGHIETIWGQIGEPVMMVMEAAWEQLQDVAETVWNVIRTVIETVLGVIGGLIDTVTAIFQGDWEAAHEAMLEVGETIWEGIKKIVKFAIEFAQRTIERVLRTIRRVWGNVWGRISDFLSDTWEDIKTAVSTGIDSVVEWVQELPGRAWDALTEFGSKMLERGEEALTALWDGAKEVWGNLVEWVKELPGRILDALGDMSKVLLEAGKAIISGLWDGMKDMWDNVTGWVGGLGSTIADLKGPIEVDRILLVDQGEAIIGGLARGMESEWKNVERLLGTMTAEIPALASVQVQSHAGCASAAPQVRVFIGERELTDIVGVEIDGKMRPLQSASRSA